jgi:phage I-like protein
MRRCQPSDSEFHGCCRAVDGRQQHEVAAWIVDAAGAQRQSEEVDQEFRS